MFHTRASSPPCKSPPVCKKTLTEIPPTPPRKFQTYRKYHQSIPTQGKFPKKILISGEYSRENPTLIITPQEDSTVIKIPQFRLLT